MTDDDITIEICVQGILRIKNGDLQAIKLALGQNDTPKQEPETHEYPLALSVKDVSQIMRLNRQKVYDFTRRKDFPAIRDGNRIIIPRDAFFRWFNETALQQTK